MVINYWNLISEFFGGNKKNNLIFESTRELKTKLIRFVMKRYDEHTADEVQQLLSATEDSLKGLSSFRNKMLVKFMDDDMDELIGKIVDSKKSEEPEEPVEKEKNSKVVSGGVVKGSSGKNYISTSDAEEKEKKIAAMRAVRDAEKSDDNIAAKKLLSVSDAPELKDRSPGLTADPRVSWARRAKGYADQEYKVRSLKPNKHSHALTSPKQFPVNKQTELPAGTKVDKITDKDTKSGVVAAQRAVDKLTKDEGPARGASMAAALGVPTTAQRTITDDDGKSKVQIWNAEKIAKYMDPDVGSDKNTAKPMSRGELVKYGAIKRVAPSNTTGPGFDGTFHGQRYRRSGREDSVTRVANSKVTGNKIRFKAQVNPKNTGEDVIWDDNEKKWMLPSEWMALNADKSSKNDFSDDEKTDPGIPSFDEDDEEYSEEDGWTKV